MTGSRLAVLAHRVLIGEKLEEHMEKCVLVEDGLIKDIISAYEYEALRNTWPCVDLGAGTLLPGLYDCHSHLALDAGRKGHLEMMSLPKENHTLLAAENLEKDLHSGVTAMRCMGDRYYLDIEVREKISSGQMEGPDLLVCGIGMRSANGHGYVGLPHTGAEEFRKTSRENLLRGADHLKIFVSPGIPSASPEEEVPCFLTREEIAAVVQEAKRAGRQTTAHCIGGKGLELCVSEGIDVLDHLYSVTGKQIAFLENHFNGWVDLTTGIVMDPRREAYISEEQNVRMRKARSYSAECMSRIYSSRSLRYTIGTDAYHGMLYREIEYAVSLGADRRKAIMAVTSNAAKMTGTDKVKGRISPGYTADMIAVKENVLTEKNALANVFFVMKRGRVIRNDSPGKMSEFK